MTLVGHIPYLSKVTKREELLPFAVGLVGLPDTQYLVNSKDSALNCV
jgi:hypothetical protein